MSEATEVRAVAAPEEVRAFAAKGAFNRAMFAHLPHPWCGCSGST